MSTVEQRRLPWTILDRAGLRLRDWWRRRSELTTMDRCELERIAADLGMTGPELKDLAARGPHAADQLHERMHLFGITRADVERLAHGLMWDLERTCAHCNLKRACARELATHSHDSRWGGYCPNAAALTAVRNAMRHFPTP
jgi:hypothetical protein